MAKTVDYRDPYLAAFRAFEASLNGRSASEIHRLRRGAMDAFVQTGFPTSRDEAWRHTRVAPLLETSFAPVPSDGRRGVTAEQIAPFRFDSLGGAQLVFVDGFYSPELSSHPDLPDGAQAGNLASILDTSPERVSGELARYAAYKTHAFAALNTAFFRDGAFVFVPRGVAVEAPIYLLFISTAKDKATVSHPRVLVLAEDGSQVTLVETYAGIGHGAYLTNAVTEIAAGDNAVVDHYKLELETPEAFHIGVMQMTQGRASNVSSHAISLGGRLVRNEARARLAGEGCESTVNGLYLLGDNQHVDNHTLLEHAEPNCSSHERYKGILTDASQAVFRGKIHVHPKAQKTDAYQSNQNLLLSEGARINTKPQLEIYADDVRCSHGATVGQIDEDALFYLRARGIGAKRARQVLLQAFASDILDRVKVEPVRQALVRRVNAKFAPST